MILVTLACDGNRTPALGFPATLKELRLRLWSALAERAPALKDTPTDRKVGPHRWVAEGISLSPELISPPAAPSSLQAKKVYILAAICLAAGLAIGFVCGTPGSAAAAADTASASAASVPKAPGSGHPVSLSDMKHMADQQAAPLLQQLKANPVDTKTLAQVGAIYHVAHQYREAAEWYGRAVHSAPGDVALRTSQATSLYRAGDADAAIAQLDEALKRDPKNANALFNLGMIRLQGKADARGAVAAWRQLLRSNPDLGPDRKAAVQQLIAQVTANLNSGTPAEGGHSNGGH